ncbi:MAG: 6,7-dimethyl-8-ribityllumazine synthase [Rickettsiales bacterium]|nr:6,7-dimethyl-8-ribityllumazine synthase [Rickettsiales bacterium]
MKKILIVEARFYPEISDLLLNGAIAKLKQAGLDYEVINVMGALEIPSAISFAIESKKYAGFVALGCVIRGETSHYDIVANESARGLMKLSLKKHLAIGNGILTVENDDQAIVRADPTQKDKGGFAVAACLRMIELQKQFGINDK